jgi:hypothetical protein
VTKNPGAMSFTVMPSPPTSRESERVKPDMDMTPAGFRTIVHIDAPVRAVSRQQA